MKESLFIWIPKTAGTSIFNGLKDYGIVQHKIIFNNLSKGTDYFIIDANSSKKKA